MLFGGIMYFAQNAVPEKFPVTKVCLNWGWEDRIANDVMFVGSSRSYRAVDTVTLTQKLKDSHSGFNGADIIFLQGPDITQKFSSFRSLVEGKPVPKVLIIENMFRQRKIKLKQLSRNKMKLKLQEVDKRYMPLSHIHFLRQELGQSSPYFSLKYFSSEYENIYETVADRISSSFYSFLGEPKYLFNQRSDICPDEFKSWNLRLKSQENNSQNSIKLRRINDVEHNEYVKDVQSYAPLNPASKHRAYEIKMMNILIEEAKAFGVEKVYVWLPNDYLLGYSKETHEQLISAYPGADAIIYPEIVNAMKKKKKRFLFLNGNHVNLVGQQLITEFWYEFLTSN